MSRQVSEQPGRYQRSPAAMVGALVVVVALVAGFVLLRDAGRETPTRPARTVDYHQVAQRAARDGTLQVLAPPRLPEGWRATSARFEPGPSPRWHLGVLTDQGHYVGLQQSGSSARELVTTYVDPEATRGPSVQVDGPGGVAAWTSWTDAGGDFALSRTVAGSAVLVVGTAPRKRIIDYTAHLVELGPVRG